MTYLEPSVAHRSPAGYRRHPSHIATSECSRAGADLRKSAFGQNRSFAARLKSNQTITTVSPLMPRETGLSTLPGVNSCAGAHRYGALWHLLKRWPGRLTVGQCGSGWIGDVEGGQLENLDCGRTRRSDHGCRYLTRMAIVRLSEGGLFVWRANSRRAERRGLKRRRNINFQYRVN
jgi:hypothetical protein